MDLKEIKEAEGELKDLIFSAVYSYVKKCGVTKVAVDVEATGIYEVPGAGPYYQYQVNVETTL